MEVSTFELLIKPIAPRTPVTEAVARRVIQGYFLTISNLEDKRLRYTIEFFDSTPNPPSTNRELEADSRPTGNLVIPRNFNLIYDVAGANTDLIRIRRGTEGQIAGDFFLDPKQTASVQLLPDLSALSADPNLEIRGYVNLRLPGNLIAPQNDSPVKVLLQPEIRGTFLPNDFPDSSGGDFDQINYSLTTASGKALNELEPEPRTLTFPIPAPPIVDIVPEDLFDNIGLADMSDRERVEMLVTSVAQIEPSAENLQNLDQILADLNIPISMGIR
ncbi:MAG: hypothetical protein AAF652_07510 [Cyanobacteria bacterium P01_C01_bin.72]